MPGGTNKATGKSAATKAAPRVATAAGSSFLVGPRLYLRGLLEEDADGPYRHWFNDAEVCSGNSHHVFPYTQQAALAYIRHAAQTRDDLILAVVLRTGHRHIGNIALQHIHPVNRSAELAVVLGDRTAWGKGYASEAARLLCDHGFAALNLHRIACGTFEGNTAMRRLALSLGMREEGRRRQAAFKEGRYVDLIEYGVLRDEYYQAGPPGPGKEVS
jgi:RimJ/RimL family protein N-acetyltransferase